MNSKNIPFQTIDWSKIPKTEHKGEAGTAYWQTLQFDGLRIRIVEYSAGYVADHWCEKVIQFIALKVKSLMSKKKVQVQF